MLRFITATRLTLDAFKAQSLLCRSLERVNKHTPIELNVFPENGLPLGALYNQKIDSAKPDDILVFIHDDVWIDDWMIGLRLEEALAQFDVVGAVGNRRRYPGQETWWWGASGGFDVGFLSGCVSHGAPASGVVNVYGPAPAEVKLLGGLMLAARASSLHASQVRFDPALPFDFYDLDFCRSCEQAGLRMGVWPVALTHQSAGPGVNGESWKQARARYFQKWQE